MSLSFYVPTCTKKPRARYLILVTGSLCDSSTRKVPLMRVQTSAMFANALQQKLQVRVGQDTDAFEQMKSRVHTGANIVRVHVCSIE